METKPLSMDQSALADLDKRPQLWGSVIHTVVEGVECHISIPKEYGALSVLSRWPCLVFLSESPDGRYNRFNPKESGWFVQGSTDEGLPDVNSEPRCLPFVIVSPTASTEKKWGQRVDELQAAITSLRSKLYISARRMHLVGVGDGADAIFDWEIAHPDMFAAFVFVCSSTLSRLSTSKWTTRPCRVLVDKKQTGPALRTDITELFREQDQELFELIFVTSKPTKKVDPEDETFELYDDTLRQPKLYAWLMDISKPIDLSGNVTTSTKDLLMHLAEYVGDDEDNIYKDTYGNGVGLQGFEEQIATLLGKDSGCFTMTGTCANQMAVRAAVDLQASRNIVQQEGGYSSGSLLVNRGVAVRAKDESRMALVHWTSHLVHLTHLFDFVIQREAFIHLAKKNLFGLNVVPSGHFNRALSFADLQKDLHKWKSAPAVIVVEIPQRMNGGATMSFEDLRQLRAICQERKIHMHMDGARLWEVQPYYGRSLSEICGLFDSVYVSFYKGLGALSGAMLLGDEAFIESAKGWRHRLGGQPYTFMPAWIDSKRSLDATLPEFQFRFERMCRVVELMKDEMIVYPGGIIRLVPEVPQSCMIHVYLRAPTEVAIAAHEKAAQMSHVRLWNKIRGTGFSAFVFPDSTEGCYFEWTMGKENCEIDLSEIVEGWNAFLGILHLSIRHNGIKLGPRPRRISASPSRSFVQRSMFTNWTGLKTRSEQSEDSAFPAWRGVVGKMGSLNASQPFIHE
eukprot:m.88346 g.88346  ORF g.88346 m.88346 type:complete len:738 (+) comp26184_c0_seq1:206-2419(+)